MECVISVPNMNGLKQPSKVYTATGFHGYKDIFQNTILSCFFVNVCVCVGGGGGGGK